MNVRGQFPFFEKGRWPRICDSLTDYITHGSKVVVPAAVTEHKTRFSTFSAASVGVVPVLNNNPPTETMSPTASPETPVTFWNLVGCVPDNVCTFIAVLAARRGGSASIVNAVGGVLLVSMDATLAVTCASSSRTRAVVSVNVFATRGLIPLG